MTTSTPEIVAALRARVYDVLHFLLHGPARATSASAPRARETPDVRYMVIETYTSGPGPVYARAAERGRLLPPGLRYVDSWVIDDDALDRCFQLMETDDPALFDAWTAAWSDVATFEIHPVIDSVQAAARVDVSWGGAR